MGMGAGEMPVLRFTCFGIPLIVRIEDLGYGELFPGLSVHMSFGTSGQPHGVFWCLSDNGVLVNVYPKLRCGGP